MVKTGRMGSEVERDCNDQIISADLFTRAEIERALILE